MLRFNLAEVTRVEKGVKGCNYPRASHDIVPDDAGILEFPVSDARFPMSAVRGFSFLRGQEVVSIVQCRLRRVMRQALVM